MQVCRDDLSMPLPMVLAVSRIDGSRPVPAAAVDCRFAKRAPAEVAEPATAVCRSSPGSGRNAKAAPVAQGGADRGGLAQKFMTKARP